RALPSAAAREQSARAGEGEAARAAIAASAASRPTCRRTPRIAFSPAPRSSIAAARDAIGRHDSGASTPVSTADPPPSDVAPRAGSAHARPLAGLRILAASQLGAGPWALTLLSDLGADVMKLESPGRGDEARHVPPFAGGGDSLYFQALNRGCRGLTLDLRHPRGREVLRRLVPACDAVYNNLRGGEPARLGLTYESLRDANPRVVCCSLSGFGQTGPRAGEPGYDFLVQAYAGYMSLTGEPDGPPARAGVSVIDFSAGILSALALMIGLHRARHSGSGCEI